jgi:hypothetical protein
MLEPRLITKTELKSRGWTDALIARFFPTPTKENPNPHYRSAAPVKLYDVAQVASIESTAEFKDALSAAADRSQRAKAKAAGRRAATIQWAEDLPTPEIPTYSRDELRDLACHHYEELWLARGKEKHADITAPDGFLDRISVNFLRHQLSPYEERLFRSRGRVGASEARAIIRRQVLSTISKAYPWLSDECSKQMLRGA